MMCLGKKQIHSKVILLRVKYDIINLTYSKTQKIGKVITQISIKIKLHGYLMLDHYDLTIES